MTPARLHEEHRQQKAGHWPGRPSRPGWLIDLAAEEQHDRARFGSPAGKARFRRDGACPRCHLLRAANGTCGC